MPERWRDPLDPEELTDLRACYGDFPTAEARFTVGARFFRDMKVSPLGPTRRGEVLVVPIAPDGSILVHTKRFYPPNTFRLLTGGIHMGEPVEVALAREVREETGLEVRARCLIGIITYRIEHRGQVVLFASYVYRVDAPTTDVAPEDDEEEISGFRWVPPAALREIRDRLRDVPPEWRDWGAFRAVGHDFVLRHGSRCGIFPQQ